jgi:hypothetical protein
VLQWLGTFVGMKTYQRIRNGIQLARVQEFKRSRVQGFKSSRVQGFKSSRVQGLRRHLAENGISYHIDYLTIVKCFFGMFRNLTVDFVFISYELILKVSNRLRGTCYFIGGQDDYGAWI